MGVLLTILASVGALVGAVAIGLLKDEVAAWLPKLNRVLIALAVRRLPEDNQDRYSEEWLAHIDEYPGKISQLLQAIKILNASWEISSSHERIQVCRLVSLTMVATGNAFVVALLEISSSGVLAVDQIEFWINIVCLIVAMWCGYGYVKLAPWLFGPLLRRR